MEIITLSNTYKKVGVSLISKLKAIKMKFSYLAYIISLLLLNLERAGTQSWVSFLSQQSSQLLMNCTLRHHWGEKEIENCA